MADVRWIDGVLAGISLIEGRSANAVELCTSLCQVSALIEKPTATHQVDGSQHPVPQLPAFHCLTADSTMRRIAASRGSLPLFGAANREFIVWPPKQR